MVSRALIETLFSGSRSMMAFPVRMVYMTKERQVGDEPLQLLISVPKKFFKLAVDRNRVRRLTRECYRLRKHALYDFLQQHGLTLVFSMVYIHNEIMSYDQLGHKMDKLLAALQKDILAHQQPTP